MYRVVVSDHFDAAHHLPGVDVCCRPHGHSWRIEACVSSPGLNDQRMVVDFRDIKACWRKYDHQDLNDFIDMPTAEELCRILWNDIDAAAKMSNQGACIEWVKIWESPDAYCEYRSN